MPKRTIDYSNNIIYKIVCNDLNVKDVYVGHTTQFTKRKCVHKSNCTNKNVVSYNFKVYKAIRDNGGWENWSMIEIEKYNCKDGNEASSRERYWYETLNANLNNHCPNRTVKEYRDINKDYYKDYYENNKEKKREYYKVYNENNKEKLKEKQKQYREQRKLKTSITQ